MYKRISRIFVVLFFVGIVSYLFYYNPQQVPVHFGSQTTFELPLALSLILSFCSGLLFLGLIAVFIGFKFKMEQWKKDRMMKSKETHYAELAKAHDLLALKDGEGARTILQKIVQKDPSDILSRLSLAKTYYLQNRPQDAIKLLEEARAEQGRSPALLVTIADAQIAAGNKTAAHDSILLALRDSPKNISLLEKAITLSRDLGKTGDARFLADELLRACPYVEQEKIKEILASIELEELQSLKSTDKVTYLKKLQTLVKDHKDFTPGIIEYANYLFEEKEYDQAVKLLRKAVSKSNSIPALKQLITFWLETDNPSEALGILREILSQNISNEKSGIAVAAQSLLAQLLLHLEHIDEAREEIKKLEKLFEKDQSKGLFLLALKAKLDSRSPNRGKTNLSLEKMVLEEAINAGIPSLAAKNIHPNLHQETSI